MRTSYKTILCILAATVLNLTVHAQIQLDLTPEAESTKSNSSNLNSSNNSTPIHSMTSERTGEDVFGARLFQGAFSEVSFSGFSPEYRVAIGDTVQLMLWGGINEQAELIVDPQGNLFIAEVGPVPVAGVRNADLQTHIAKRIESVFSDTVQSYAVLGSTQPVKVFVTGAVNRPGLYGGFSSDNILLYLDKAGGINLDEGSFIDISVIHGDNTVEKHSLYDFLVDGQLSLIQFSDGDRILVHPLRSTYTVAGDVRNPHRFEFKGETLPLSEALLLAQPEPSATNVSIERKINGRRSAATYPLSAVEGLKVYPSDRITLSSDLKSDSILISIEGEHNGAAHQVQPYGATVADAIAAISPSERSNIDAIQLYRKSVAKRQKKRINESLDNMERDILSARSGSIEEAKIRTEEAELILRFIQRARASAEPRGHVILAKDAAQSQIALEDGDVIYIPTRTQLVAVHGQIMFPTTQVWQDDKTVKDYIMMSGGLTENADDDRILIVKANGIVRDLKSLSRSFKSYKPQPGEEIIVLTKPDTKTMQFAKDLSTIIYQIAIAARVAVDM